MAMWNRLVNLFRKQQLSAEIDRELMFHIEERVDALMASGMSETEARREAVRRFGEPLHQRERTRDVDVLAWLDTALADVRYGVRALLASPVITLVSIVSLALGIGANTAIFSVIDAVVLKDLPVYRPDELIRVTREGTRGVFTNPIWEELRDRQDFLRGALAFGDARFNLAEGGEARWALGSWVSGEYFATLGLQPAVGRLPGREDDVRGCAPVAVLSHAFWRSEYGADAGAIGTRLTLDGQGYDIIGVVQPGFSGLSQGSSAQVFVPLCTREIGNPGVLDRRTHWYLQLIGRTAPDMSLEQARQRLSAIAPGIYAATAPGDWSVEDQRTYMNNTLFAVPAANGDSSLWRQYSRPLLTLMGLVAMVLLIACVNVANLLLARGTMRQGEIAIRLALGAGRARLIRQLLTESLLLALVGSALGLLVAQGGGRLLVMLLSGGPVPVQLELSMNGRVLGFTMIVGTLTGLLFGLAPAWRATRIAPHVAVKAGSRGIAGTRGRSRAAGAMVSAQVALSLVLLVGAGLMVGTFRRLATVDAGFVRDDVLLVDVNLPDTNAPPDRMLGAYHDVLERIRALPGIVSASASFVTPIGGSTWNNYVAVDGYVPASRDDALVYFNAVSDGYFATLQTRLLTGRDFDRRDVAGAPRVAVVNRAMASRFFGTTNPVGREFRTRTSGDAHDPPVRIIGVVENAKYESLRETPLPIAYVALSQESRPWPTATLLVRSSTASATMRQAVIEQVASVDPRISLEFATLEEQVASSLARERMLALLSTFFGALALLLAVIGLYGTLSYGVARRRREIGVRLALGAAPMRVLRMVLGEAGLLVLVGLAIGVAIALSVSRLVSALLFGLEPTDFGTVALACAVLAVVTFAASTIPAWRAARTDALIPLRED